MDEHSTRYYYNSARSILIAFFVFFMIFMTVKGYAFVYDVEPPDIESVARDHDREVHKEAGIERDEDGNGRV